MAIEILDLKAVPENRRANTLTEAISRSFASCDCGYDADDRSVDVSFRKLSLERLSVVQFAGRGSQWAQRSHHQVRRDRTDAILVYLPRRSRIRLRQSGREATLSGSEVGFVRTRTAFAGEIRGRGNEIHSSLHFALPGPLVRSRVPAVDELAGVAADVGPVLERLLLENTRALLGTASAGDSALTRAISGVLFETLSSVAAYVLDRTCPSRPPSASARALERIRTYALANLADPTLGIGAISEALRVSERYVHAAFAGTGWTAKRWIQHQRLLECRRTIRSPALADRSLTDIALDWGFSDPSHFARSYRKAFGVSPSADRRNGGAGSSGPVPG